MKKIIFVMLMTVVFIFSGCAKSSNNTDSSSQPDTKREQAADFTLKNINGDEIKLSDYKGKTVVMNFFATWCPPCKSELPGFMKTKENYKDKEAVFLFIDVQESSDTVKSFVDDRGYTDMNPLLDSEGSVSEKYGIRGIPRTFILDKEGNIAFSHEGYLDDAALESAIDSVLKETDQK